MTKSRKNNSVLLHGFLNVEDGIVTEVIEKKNQETEEYVYNLKSILEQFNDKEVAI